MQIPRCVVAVLEDLPVRYRELMHLHQNPNRARRENPPRNAALQIKPSSLDDLTSERLAKPDEACYL
jgi:hypothetical protein